MRKELETLLIPPGDMAEIDREAARSGLSSVGLMERAGQAVAAAALRLGPDALRFVVLCGPGNNGGDGYVVARALAGAGATLAVYALGAPSGDAASVRQDFLGPVEPLSAYVAQPGDMVVDGLFGAGLARDVPPEVKRVIAHVTGLSLPVIAIDLPSGIDGRTGEVRGAAFTARASVTFMCRKPGHLLMPGWAHCGAVDVFDIGIPARLVLRRSGHLRVNDPAIWRASLPEAASDAHKYRKGHLAVFSGGPAATGAARLSAAAGLKAGAGLVTLLSPSQALAANAAHLTAVMLKPIDNDDDLKSLVGDARLATFVLGPGFGETARARTYAALLADRRLVLDADGITAFGEHPDALFGAFAQGETRLVLTPHDGEFARLFPDLAADPSLSKTDRALMAAARSNGVVVLKGADTVIAAPDGRALINANAPRFLATAGSGDVLAGIIGAHMAQGMPAFEAAASGVWRHGEAGRAAGKGMTAEDLVAAIRPLKPD